MKAEELEIPSTPDVTTYIAERRALLAATPRIVGAPDRVAVFRSDEERQLAVIEAAAEIAFVFGTGAVEQVIHRNDVRHLQSALDALTGGTDD